MIYLVLAGLLLVVAGIAKAIKDMCAEGHWKKQWWNKNLSWPLKWKNGDPKQGERFPLSSTLLVGFTDGWHLFQMLEIIFVFTAMSLLNYPWWILALGGLFIYLVSFTLVYRILKKKA